MQDYKHVEREHYDSKASELAQENLALTGSDAVPRELRSPYLDFEAVVREHAERGSRVVDLGAGTGIHSLTAREAALRTPIDISFPALRIAAERGRRNGISVEPVICDAESTPFASSSVDLVTSAGALYCFDFERVSAEVRRILRPGGAWVIVDSFDHNPLYRLNRRIGYLLGRRTRRAVTNIPNESWVEALRRQFERVDVRYFGAMSFLLPLLKPLIGAERAAGAVDWFDRVFPGVRRYAFKIVVTAERPVGTAQVV